MDRITLSAGRQVLHIDFDSFFASVEQQYNLNLRGKPIGVTAANSRTCIIASSREAKRFGIKTGAKSYEAKRICPSLILVPASFVKYFEVSKKFLNICKDYTPYTELFSIDEVFMDVTKTTHLFGGPYGIIEKIKTRIKKEIGECITVSIGISYNKLLAKLASGLNKPEGVFEIKAKDVGGIYKKAKLTDVCGIGEKIRERLNKIGIYTLLELKNISLQKLIFEFGTCEAQFLKNIGLAIDNALVIPYTTPPPVKSVGRSYCLQKNEYDKKRVLQNLFELCEEVSLKLRRLGKKARTIGLSLRGTDNFMKRKTYKDYFDTGKEIFTACLFLSSSHLPGGNSVYVRQIGVWASNLEDKINTSLSLLDVNSKKEKLIKTVDVINKRFGDHTIRNGFLLYADKLTTVPNGYMADKYERLKLVNS